MLIALYTVGILWLVVLTFLTVKVYLSWHRLSKEVDKGNLIKLMTNLLEQGKKNQTGLAELRKAVGELEDKNLSNIQKIELLRYNPFQELGGEHSFSLVFLDGKKNGVLITGLHSRDKTRIYLKKIANGRGDVNLSKEESKVLTTALK